MFLKNKPRLAKCLSKINFCRSSANRTQCISPPMVGLKDKILLFLNYLFLTQGLSKKSHKWVHQLRIVSLCLVWLLSWLVTWWWWTLHPFYQHMSKIRRIMAFGLMAKVQMVLMFHSFSPFSQLHKSCSLLSMQWLKTILVPRILFCSVSP